MSGYFGSYFGAPADSPGVTTLLGRVTGAADAAAASVAADLSTISSNVVSVGVAVAAVAAKTTNLPSDPASETNATTNKQAVLAAVGEGKGDGDVLVDHNFADPHTIGGVVIAGGQNSLKITNELTGAPIGNAEITAYLTSEIVTNAGTAVPKDRTSTADDGTWQSPLKLSSGVSYSLLVKQSDTFGSMRIDITVP